MSIKKRVIQTGAALALSSFVGMSNNADVEAASWQPRTVSEIKSDIQNQVTNQSEKSAVEYTFKPGDTLWAVSRATNISVDKLAQVNQIDNENTIIAGNNVYLSENKDVVSVDNGQEVESYDISQENIEKTETPKEVEEEVKHDRETNEVNKTSNQQAAEEAEQRRQEEAERQAAEEEQNNVLGATTTAVGGDTNEDLNQQRENSRRQREQERIEQAELEKRRAESRAEAEEARQQREAERQKAQSTSNAGFVMPAQGNVSSNFGPRWGSHHDGMDIAGGGPIVAAQTGTVVRAQSHPTLGNFVDIQHGNGTTTRYAHLSGMNVSAGQTVQQGQTLGTMGATGNATGTHLHFEVHQGGTPVNPAQFF